jgi:four helix bundle protein
MGVESGRREGEGPGYQGLIAWQRAMDLVEAVYVTTRKWPREEMYGLTQQARRAAISIPSNIAEGHGRSGTKEYAHHVSVAYGSLSELETQILIGERLGYHPESETRGLLQRTSEVRRILRGLLKSLRAPTQPQ